MQHSSSPALPSAHRQQKQSFWPLAVAGLLTAFASSACAEGPSATVDGLPNPSIATILPPEITDPGGVRTSLAARGIKYGANYIGEVLDVVSGGLKTGAKYHGRLELFTEWDLERLAGWRGLTFFANGFQIHGGSITADQIGSYAPASSIEGTPATRLFELWIEQSFADGNISLRVGQQSADSEFLIAESGASFVGATFGWPAMLAADLPDGGPAFPLSAPAARLKLKPNDRLTVLAAVFNGQAAYDCVSADPQRCNNDGLLFPVGDPPLAFLEGQFRYSLGLPGTLKLGGWRHFGNFDDNRFDSSRFRLAFTGHSAFVHGGNHGTYAIVEQKIHAVAGSDSRGIDMFGRIMASPDDRNLIALYVDGGVLLTGLLSARPDDVLGLGLAYSRFGGGVRGFDRDRNLAAGIDAAIRDGEAVLELTYKAQIVPGWTIQPDLQYFRHPGGGGVDPDDDANGLARPRSATVIGARTTLKY